MRRMILHMILHQSDMKPGLTAHCAPVTCPCRFPEGLVDNNVVLRGMIYE